MDGADCRIEMIFQDTCVPQWVGKGFEDYIGARDNELLIPLREFSAAEHGDWFTGVEIRLPVAEVDKET